MARDLQRCGDVSLRHRIAEAAHDLSGMTLLMRRNYLLAQGTPAAMAGFASVFARFARDDAGFQQGIAALAQVMVGEHRRHPQAMRKVDPRQLSNLANAISKLPGDGDCRQALQSVAGAVCARARELADPRVFNTQSLSNLANALSKLPGNDRCRQALQAIAQALPARAHELADPQRFQPQHLSNLANALIKLPDDEHARDALTAIARVLPARARELAHPRDFNAQGLSNLANALSKLPHDEPCRHGLQAIARGVLARERELADLRAFNPQNLSNLANALSKLPSDELCRDALKAIAWAVPARARELAHPRDFNGQDLSNLANGLSKVPDNEHGQQALKAIARALSARVRELDDPSEFSAHGLSNLANALSKLLDDAHCRHALTAIARAVPARGRLLADPGAFEPQELASLANALSKLPDDGPCRQALTAIARAVHARDRELADPRHFKARSVSNLANALSKLPHDEDCRHALQIIARAVSVRSHELADTQRFNAQNLSTLANALSKLPHDIHCRDVLSAIARAIPARTHELADPRHFNTQSLSNLANALSKLPDDEHCRQALNVLAQAVSARAPLLADPRAFHPQHLSGLANALSKWLDDEHCRDALKVIARAVPARQRELADSREFNAQGLSNLANALSKLPDDGYCEEALKVIARAASARARELVDPQGFDSQSLSTLANALSKLPHDEHCRRALNEVAQAVSARAPLLADPRAFHPQHLSGLANALSKWLDDEHCRDALKAIARAVPARQRELADSREFNAQGLSNLANALSKLPDDDDGQAAMMLIARAVCVRERKLVDPMAFSTRHLSGLANAMSKLPDDEHCRQALAALARAVPSRLLDDPNGFSAQGLSTLANALRKLPDDGHCQDALQAIARAASARARELADSSEFNAQGLSILANALSKLPHDGYCQDALKAIARAASARARELADSSEFNAQDLSNLANALSKLPHDEHCRQALNVIAQAASARTHLLADPKAVKPQELASLANALSKLPDDGPCRQALNAIARAVPTRHRELADPLHFNAPGLSNLANALSKLPDDTPCQSALRAVAQAVCVRQHELTDPQKFRPQHLSNLANALVRQLEASECDQALYAIVQHLGSGGRAFGEFGMIDLTQVAHACSRYAAAPPVAPEDHELALSRLRQLAQHLGDHPEIISNADTLATASLLRAFGSPQLRDELRQLAGPALKRLDELHRTTQFKPDDLETIGSLCAGLLPLLRGPQARGRQHRREALRLLDKARPVIDRKIDLYLASKTPAANVSRPGEAFATRAPSLSVFQVLSAYLAVKLLPSPRGAAADGALDDWLKGLLERTQESADVDLSGASWNMIAQIEADNPLNALDDFMQTHLQRVTDARPSTPFDVQQVLRSMDHEPRPPQPGQGVMDIPVVNLGGRPVGRSLGDGGPRYSAFARLTQGRVPLVSVQLPGQLSSFLLGRTVRVRPPGDAAAQPVHYRMDLFGGSRMKAKKSRSEEAAEAGRHGELIGLPLSETAPGSAFDALARKLFPYKESFYYFQRMMLASPPSLAGAVGEAGAAGHVLEGRFRLAVLPDDQPDSAQRPFKLANARGEPIALRPFDGCGFVKESVAQRMPTCRRVLQGQRGEQDRVPAFGEREPANLPSMALQHYPRDDRVVHEAAESMRRQLRDPDALRGAQAAYRSATTTRMQGRISVAVPAADDKLHLPALKSKHLDADTGLLVGRSPYDKPNLRPIEPARVGTVAGQDPTAEFLSTATAIQYGFVAQEAASPQAGDNDAPMFFAKGLMVVVPDALWPKDFEDRDMVMSAEDIKTHSSWTASKDRVTTPADVSSTGILMATEVLAPGSLVAVPPAEQKKLDGDFDGDPLTIVSDRPALFDLVKQQDQLHRPPALKPPKTHTPAIDAQGRYQYGRAKEILATKEQVMETYSVLQRSYCAQPEAAKAWFAQRALFGSYEGIAPELQQQVQGLLEQDAPDAQTLRDVAAQARAQAGSANPDTGARHPVAKEIDALMAEQLEHWAQTSPQAAASAARTLSPQAQSLFPRLAQEYAQAATPPERLAVLMDRYPTRQLTSRVGYVPDDPLQSAHNLLSVGIKVGTDAYKADTAVSAFSWIGHRLKSLMATIPGGVRAVPYSSALADKLQDGRFDYDDALRSLEQNPTLAGAVMHTALHTIGKQRLEAVANRQPALTAARPPLIQAPSPG